MEPAKLSQLIDQTDYIRFSAFGGIANRDWQKEWHHFCILGPGLHIILNLNLSGDTRPAARPDEVLARVVLLVREKGWDGDVETIPARDVQFCSGQVGLIAGHNQVQFRDGVFDLSIALQDRPITLALRLRPIATPLLMRSNTSIGAGRINWLVAPRWLANGIVVIDRRVHKLQDTPAYHDHNWGYWLWGQDFAWEWGFALPEDREVPWSIVFDRTTDRSRGKALELTLALWKNADLYRVFTQREIHIQPGDYLPLNRLPKFPRVMSVVSPETTTDVPRRLMVTATAGTDHLKFVFEAEDVAQVVIPNETDLGVTIINEVVGMVSLEGEVKGESVAMLGRATFEFLT